MCDPFGSQTRAHHRQQEQMRAESAQRGMIEAAERARQAEQQRMLAFQQAAQKQQEEALAAIVASSKSPMKVKGTEDATTPLMRTKQKQSGAQAGIASLRINRTPGTNLSMGTSGTNIG